MLAEYLARELARVGSKRLPRRMDPHTFIMKHELAANRWNEPISSPTRGTNMTPCF
jgi:hypothetical protein